MVRWISFALAVGFPLFGNAHVVVTPIDYSDGDVELQGFLAKPHGASESDPRPAVVILPNSDGVNDYEIERAHMIAEEFGWAAFAADIYGKDKHNIETREERSELAGMYRDNPTLAASRMNAAINTVKSVEYVDENKVAMIGYCFGGTLVITYSVIGEDQVVAVVSFHGGLSTVPETGPLIAPKMLVLSGGIDDASSEIVDLEEKLNEGNATWEITRYSGVDHAFTDASDERYNALADARSWLSMYGFLAEAFGEVPYDGMEPDAPDVVSIDYTDVDGAELRGYLSLPDPDKFTTPAPAIIVLPDWDGTNEYEHLRATLLAQYGYVGFAADIFGKDKQDDLSFDERIELTNLYRSNTTLLVQRIQRAIDLVKETVPEVDPANIGVIGYCFGGTAAVYYAFSGRDDVKFIAPFHGGLTELPDSNVDISSYVLVLSGGIDDAHGNQTVLEQTLDNAMADWEITRYSQVDHGFTVWNSSAYSLRADARSWESTMLALNEFMPIPGVDGTRVGGSTESSTATSGAFGFQLLLPVALLLGIMGKMCS